MTKQEIKNLSMSALWNLCYDNGIQLVFDTGNEMAEDVMAFMAAKLKYRLNEKPREHTDR